MRHLKKNNHAYKNEETPYGGGAPVVVLPTYIEPSFSISVSPDDTIRKVGDTQVYDITPNFDRGSIQIDGAEQDKRSGVISSYGLDGSVVTEPISKSITIVEGDNDMSLQVFYEAGPQPLDSLGNEVDSPYSAGSIIKSKTVEGVLPIVSVPYVDGSETMADVLEEVMLVSYSSNSFLIEIASETADLQAGTESKWKILIPKALYDSLSSVEIFQFNNLTTQDYTNDLTGNFSVTQPVSFTVNGTAYDYVELENTDNTLTLSKLDAKINLIS